MPHFAEKKIIYLNILYLRGLSSRPSEDQTLRMPIPFLTRICIQANAGCAYIAPLSRGSGTLLSIWQILDFFPNLFDLQFVPSMDMKPTHTEGQLYINMHINEYMPDMHT